jgi:hypothetical protein
MKPGTLSGFSLEKQYFDCIDDRGDCFIIYRAELRYFFIRIHYSELIHSDSSGITSGNTSLVKTINQGTGDLLLYINNHFKIRGSWKRVDSPLQVYTLTNPANRELTWNCHHPKTNTEITYQGNAFTGYGYAETLFLTIKPSDLQLNSVRWGHFHSDGFTLIWITLKGTYPVNKIYCNGKEFNDVQYDEEGLRFDGTRYQLKFLENTTIRKGKLASLFSSMPWIKIIFKKSLLSTSENKFKSKSALFHNQIISATGWSLYEIVTWKS